VPPGRALPYRQDSLVGAYGRKKEPEVLKVDMVLDIESSARHWWAFALRGVAAVIFGVLAFVWPFLTLSVLVLLWGAFALIDGILALIAAFRVKHDHRWALLIEGIVGIGAGIVTFAYPQLTALVLLYIIAIWALITGVLEIVAAVRLRKVIDNEWWLILTGIVSVLFGIVLLAAPSAGALAVVWLIGAYAIVFGVLMIALSLRLHGMSQRRHAVGMA
jgi:uncharacterized membrane protein HdeD (DUF308 family)